MEEITLNKQQRIYLLTAAKAGTINVEEMRNILGISNPVINLELISTNLPFSYDEAEVNI